jgi:hypothetical protein
MLRLPALLLVLILCSVCNAQDLSLNQTYHFADWKKPNFSETPFVPSQEHPVCIIQTAHQTQQLYYCGHANDFQRNWEAYHAVRLAQTVTS